MEGEEFEVEESVVEESVSEELVVEEATAVSRFLSCVCEGADGDSYGGKRDATRFSEGAALELMIDPKKPTRISNVYMHNASDGGCAFWSKKKIAPRQAVRLRACSEFGDEPWVEAFATHCTVGIRGYLIGVSFDGDGSCDCA